MTTELDRATDALFPSTGNRVGNIKFFRGTRRVITAEQLAEQLNRADTQVRDPEARPVVDIDNYSAS